MDFMQIFTLITGVIYIVLEIRQKNFMWVVGIATSVAAMWVFFRQGLYASFGLNTYYLVTSFIGLWQWRKAKAGMAEAMETEDADAVHLHRLSWRTVLVSLAVAVAGIFALAELMELLENPMSYLDAAVAVLSAVATWWLVRSYIEQWWLWIVADTLSTILCATQGMWWMAALYAAYTLSAVYGYVHWKRKGLYI
ncbi:MAG: nicotinamide mononucleotide transporter [Bacteroidales bacterium]|nr:nicotinamide mononucleotide transporter [Bacteroidales bacterium]